ncbi:MAG: intradiol ring-cleavage dioxygenase [Chloroflexi bacterium]|nr:MAG: intradiol ring-cleavage dioxygenase [Chloroflexota bacterium]
MDNDDAPIGRILNRREVLALLGGSGAALLAACAPGVLAKPSPTAQPTSAAATTAAAAASPATTLPSCIVRPAVTEGPYFVDEKLNRSDIRSDPASGAVKAGAPLALTFLVSRVTGSACAALSGATVDIWHCDALGVYSDATDPSFNTKGQKFLRGYQTTDASGQVQFTTIYPGWYQGRAVHIHFKIRTTTSEFTSQLFFEDALNTQVFAQSPYSQKGTQGIMRNAADGIYNSQLLLSVTKSGNAYAATFDIGLAS